MSEYRIHEVYPDGTLHDTNKVIECEDLNDNNHSVIVRNALAAYGFRNSYDRYYKAKLGTHSETIVIYYNYVDGGFKDTFILFKEDNETKEDGNEF